MLYNWLYAPVEISYTRPSMHVWGPGSDTLILVIPESLLILFISQQKQLGSHRTVKVEGDTCFFQHLLPLPLLFFVIQLFN